jgi:creatinine amidohydrolase
MLALGDVRTGQIEAGNDEPLAGLIGRLHAEGVRAVSSNGVLGDPIGASAAEGRALLAAAVDDLCATLAARPASVPEAAR